MGAQRLHYRMKSIHAIRIPKCLSHASPNHCPAPKILLSSCSDCPTPNAAIRESRARAKNILMARDASKQSRNQQQTPRNSASPPPPWSNILPLLEAPDQEQISRQQLHFAQPPGPPSMSRGFSPSPQQMARSNSPPPQIPRSSGTSPTPQYSSPQYAPAQMIRSATSPSRPHMGNSPSIIPQAMPPARFTTSPPILPQSMPWMYNSPLIIPQTMPMQRPGASPLMMPEPMPRNRMANSPQMIPQAHPRAGSSSPAMLHPFPRTSTSPSVLGIGLGGMQPGAWGGQFVGELMNTAGGFKSSSVTPRLPTF